MTNLGYIPPKAVALSRPDFRQTDIVNTTKLYPSREATLIVRLYPSREATLIVRPFFHYRSYDIIRERLL
jgi:hypothetical protein